MEASSRKASLGKKGGGPPRVWRLAGPSSPGLVRLGRCIAWSNCCFFEVALRLRAVRAGEKQSEIDGVICLVNSCIGGAWPFIVDGVICLVEGFVWLLLAVVVHGRS